MLILASWSQAAEILIVKPAADLARRWNIADDTLVPPRPLDHAEIDRIARVRDAAHDLNASEVFTSSTAFPVS